MEALEAIEILAKKAREEDAPQTDVRINHLLKALPPEETVFSVLAWPAAVSALAACILLGLALHLSQSSSSSDTVSPLFAPVQVQMP